MDVMTRLESSSLDILRDRFMEFGSGLNLEQFVEIMLKYLPKAKDAEDEVDLVMELVELFTQIDVNGDATLEWDEFTSHCIEAGMLATRKVDKPLAEVYQRREDFKDPLAHHVVIVMRYYEALGAVLVIEANSGNIKMLDSGTLRLVRTLVVYNPSDDYFSPILSVEYVPDLGLLAVVCANLEVSFWAWEDFKSFGKTKLKSVRKLFYASNTTLYTTDDTGLILMWHLRIKMLRGRHHCICIPKGMLEGHSGTVLDFVEIKRYHMLATGGMDSKIILWDMEAEKKCGELCRHQRAVCFLQYARTHDLLLSAGYENEVYCWDMNNYQLVLKLVGHHRPCIGLQLTILSAEDRREHAVTCDADGILKLWTLNRVPSGEILAKQTFASDEQNLYQPRLILGCGPRKLLAASRELRLYEAISTYVQDFLPSKVLFNSVLDRFYVILGCHIQVFCALSGSLYDVWYHTTDTDISCICFDERMRKLIVGNVSGKVIVINALNGAVMKSTVLPNCETPSRDKDLAVINVHYNKTDKILVAVSAHSIVVLDEDIVEEKAEGSNLPILRWAHDIHPTSVNCSAFSFELSLVSTGSSDKTIRLWEFQHLRLEGECVGHVGEVTAVAFVPQKPLLISADSVGEILVWTIRPHPMPYVCMTRTFNISSVIRSNEGTMVWHKPQRRQTQTKQAFNFDPSNDNNSCQRRGTVAATLKETNHDYVETKKEISMIKTIVVTVGTDGAYLMFTADKRGDLKEWDIGVCLEELLVPTIDSAKIPSKSEGYNPKRHVEHSYRYLFEDTEDDGEQDSVAHLSFSSPSTGGTTDVFEEHRRRQKLVEAREKKLQQAKMREKLQISRQAAFEAAKKPKANAPLTVNRSFFCHGEEINCLEYVPEPLSFLTSSTDGNVRVWDNDGQRIANLTMSEAEVTGVQMGTRKSVRFSFSINVAEKDTRKRERAKGILRHLRFDKLMKIKQIGEEIRHEEEEARKHVEDVLYLSFKKGPMISALDDETPAKKDDDHKGEKASPKPNKGRNLKSLITKGLKKKRQKGAPRSPDFFHVTRALDQVLHQQEDERQLQLEQQKSSNQTDDQENTMIPYLGPISSSSSSSTALVPLPLPSPLKLENSSPKSPISPTSPMSPTSPPIFSPLRNSYESLHLESVRKQEKQNQKFKHYQIDTTPSDLLVSAIEEQREKKAGRRQKAKNSKKKLDSAAPLRTVAGVADEDVAFFGSNTKSMKVRRSTKMYDAPLSSGLASCKTLPGLREDVTSPIPTKQHNGGRRVSVMNRPAPARGRREYGSVLQKRGSGFLSKVHKIIEDQLITYNEEEKRDDASTALVLRDELSPVASKRYSEQARKKTTIKLQSLCDGSFDREYDRAESETLRSRKLTLRNSKLQYLSMKEMQDMSKSPPVKRVSIFDRVYPGLSSGEGGGSASRNRGSVSMATMRSRMRRECSSSSIHKIKENAKLRDERTNKHVIGIYSKKEILNLKIIFDQIDEDESGNVDLEELMDNLDKLNVELAQLSSIFDVIDDDHSGEITFYEMLQLFMPAATKKELKEMMSFVENKSHVEQKTKALAPLTPKERKELSELFRCYDKDGGGSLSLPELFEALNKKEYKPADQFCGDDDLIFTFQDIEKICSKNGFDIDHELSESEFIDLMHEFLNMELEIL